MRKLLIIPVVLLVLLVAPIAVSAATAPDALAGLKEFLGFLLGLADRAIDGYTEFLKAIP